MRDKGEPEGRKVTRGRLKLKKKKQGRKRADVVSGLKIQIPEERSGRVNKLVIQADVLTVIGGIINF